MENYYYLYYGLAVFVVLCAIYIFIIKRKAKKAGYGGKLEVDNTSFTPQQKQALAHGAIMAEYRGEEVLSLSFKLSKRGQYEQGLIGQWDVTDHASAMEVITDLIELKNSQKLDDNLHSTNPAHLEKMYKRIAKDLEIPIENVKKIQSTYAWDTVRAVAVASGVFG